jgi:DNA replication protein DnaC
MISRETTMENLKRLKLHRMLEILDEEVSLAQKESFDPLEIIGRLAAEQARVNDEMRRQRRVKEAKFPDIKTFDGFEWDFQPGLDKARVMELMRLDFIVQKINLLLGGNSGTAKSHVAKAIGVHACWAGYRVRFTTCEQMLRDLYGALCDHTLPMRLRAYTLPDLLIIDDVGFEEIEIKQCGNASLFLKVVNARYEKRSTIITSNIALDQWGRYLGDPVLAMAALDRFVHHAVLFHLDGPSYRDHQCKQMELNRPRSTGAAPERAKTGGRRRNALAKAPPALSPS